MAWHISAMGGTVKAKITASSSTLSGLDYLRTSVKQLVAIYILHTDTHKQIEIHRSLTVGFQINCSISNNPLLYLKLQFSITELPLIHPLLNSSGTAGDLWSHHLCAVLPLWCTWGWLPKQHPNGDERKLHFLWKSQIGPDQWCQRTSDRQQR